MWVKIAAALAGEDEARRRLPRASRPNVSARDQPVEGAVDLDRIEPLGVEGKLIASLAMQRWRVERSAPVPVAPARRPDPSTVPA